MQIFQHFPQQPGTDVLIPALDSRQVITHEHSAMATFSCSRVVFKLQTSLPGIAARPTNKLGRLHCELSDIYDRIAITGKVKTGLFPI